MVKNLPVNAGDVRDTSSLPESGRNSGGTNGNPPQCSCLVHSMDKGAWQAKVQEVSESQRQLSELGMGVLEVRTTARNWVLKSYCLRRIMKKIILAVEEIIKPNLCKFGNLKFTFLQVSF